LGPDVGRSMRLGTELVIRHREVGRRFGVLARGARIQLYYATPKLAVWPNQAVE
jgi:hypothetical protein